jgi:hypothetical protein
MKSIIFWDMTPYSPLNFNRRFGGTYLLHLHGQRSKFSKKSASKQVANRLLASWFFAEFTSSTFLATDPEVPGSIPGASRFSERQWVWNGVHSAS